MKSIKLAILVTFVANLLVFGTPGQETPTASANSAPNSCQPYGPAPGYQYDPAKLMEMMGKPRENHPGPFLSAHRGVWGIYNQQPLKNAAENSIAAIDNAAALKFEMLELDVKLTKGNELVLVHD